MSPFCGPTDTPVLDFWWHLWISKPEWAALFALGRGVCITHSLRFTSGVTPANLLVASMVAKPSLPHICEAVVGVCGTPIGGSYHAATHSMRSGRRSTDWAIPVRPKFYKVYTNYFLIFNTEFQRICHWNPDLEGRLVLVQTVFLCAAFYTITM